MGFYDENPFVRGEFARQSDLVLIILFVTFFTAFFIIYYMGMRDNLLPFKPYFSNDNLDIYIFIGIALLLMIQVRHVHKKRRLSEDIWKTCRRRMC